ncbi:DUF6705 family protein [Aquimarina sp. 2201CG5-10]|uniref:DUF6705 family protein n=1 Tax=Aquimarina callyspongiae TaxID=3098150 RepID=UPI002AB4C7D8|nr:DUF6705 family protein [Aquimarina sp. 2201CG5-10]MDY8138902.1 DUF6705 family protein [Aquimarina sp. 2201CG5-10]
MKKIFIILFLTISMQGYTQTILPSEKLYSEENKNKLFSSNYYFKDVNGVLNKFLGTWRYQSENELFEITFTKRTNQRTGTGHFRDELTSRYKYVKNGVEIYNTYTMPEVDNNHPGYFIFGNWMDESNLNSINLKYKEPGIRSGDSDRLILEHIISPREQTEQLDWFADIELFEDPDNPGEYITDYKIPYKMILVKVN